MYRGVTDLVPSEDSGQTGQIPRLTPAFVMRALINKAGFLMGDEKKRRLLSSADNLCKQIGHRSGPAVCVDLDLKCLTL